MLALLWLGVAIAFAVGEMLTLAFYAVFITVGALAAALAAALGFDLPVQVIVFAVASILGVFAARPPLMHYLERRHAPDVLSGAQGMIGQDAMVVDDIRSRHEPGHVRVMGENWPAVPEDGAAIPAGTTIRIVGLRQATLVVSPKK
jgi:membrane protein implicated in regulation of membrane protease activity